MNEILQTFFQWAWTLINGVYDLWTWMITPISILSYNIAPIWLLGPTMICAGVVRAIIGII